MKGLDLPINTLIIVIVAVIVLVALVALFLGAFQINPVIDDNLAKSKACAVLLNNGCSDDGMSKSVFGMGKWNDCGDRCTVSDICSKLSITDCKKSCACQ